jgi:hypothetical protein
MTTKQAARNFRRLRGGSRSWRRSTKRERWWRLAVWGPELMSVLEVHGSKLPVARIGADLMSIRKK